MKPGTKRQPPKAILVRGARVNNLRNVDVDIPLGKMTALTGVSGSGKSSLAMGVLYAEGSARYLEGLSTYTRRRLEQTPRPQVDEVAWCPAALALSQRPPVPGPRSTVGTMTPGLAIVRLMFSRLGTHKCPNGHDVPATYRNAISPDHVCPTCQVHFEAPSAEHFSFNGAGACPACTGLGLRQEIDPATIIPDPSLTVEGGAVAPWRGLMRSNLPLVAAELGVRIDVPWQDLTDAEREIVLHGPAVTKRITVPTKSTQRAVTMNVAYVNAFDAVRQIQGEGEGKGAARFLNAFVCDACHGSRYSPAALSSRLVGLSIAELTDLPLDEMLVALARVLDIVPADTRSLAQTLLDEAQKVLPPLQALGLGYLTLARDGRTLSTGERQRIALTRVAVSNSTGLLLVVDEPTVGLHPDNVQALVELFSGLVADGNTLVVVDHDVQVLKAADHLIEVGPGAGKAGGTIVAAGSPAEIAHIQKSRIGPFLAAPAPQRVRQQLGRSPKSLRLDVGNYLNLRGIAVDFPLNRLTVVSGASGSGKSALVIDTLAPALEAQFKRLPLPPQVRSLDVAGLKRVYAVDSTPIGRNARSTLAAWSGVFDPIRRLFAETAEAGERGWTASHFSYNTKQGQCPACEGTGQFSLDLQYLPDLPMRCPTCEGKRYRADVEAVKWRGKSITDVLALNCREAADFFEGQAAIVPTLQAISEVGLDYVLLGEATPSLSGGEAQRLRLAEPIHKSQKGAVFIFDEPSIGLHPRDVHTFLGVLDRLLGQGATIIAVDHDLDLIANADWIVEMGPGSGEQGGRIIAAGPPEAVMHDQASRIARWLRPPD